MYTHTGHPPVGASPAGIQMLHWRQSSVEAGLSSSFDCGHSAERPVKSVGSSSVPYWKSSGRGWARVHRDALVMGIAYGKPPKR